MPRTKKPNLHYVDNKEFTAKIIEHRNNMFNYRVKLQELLIIYQEIKNNTPSNYLELCYFISTYLYFIALLQTKPRVSNYIGQCLYKIARGFQTKPLYINRTYPEDLCSNAVENCLKYITNFNPEKSSNAFSYFTQITYYSFLRTIYGENNQRDIETAIIEKSEFSALFNGDSVEPELRQSILEQVELRTRSLSKMENRI